LADDTAREYREIASAVLSKIEEGLNGADKAAISAVREALNAANEGVTHPILKPAKSSRPRAEIYFHQIEALALVEQMCSAGVKKWYAEQQIEEAYGLADGGLKSWRRRMPNAFKPRLLAEIEKAKAIGKYPSSADIKQKSKNYWGTMRGA